MIKPRIVLNKDGGPFRFILSDSTCWPDPDSCNDSCDDDCAKADAYRSLVCHPGVVAFPIKKLRELRRLYRKRVRGEKP